MPPLPSEEFLKLSLPMLLEYLHYENVAYGSMSHYTYDYSYCFLLFFAVLFSFP